jgi:hypothetical protein
VKVESENFSLFLYNDYLGRPRVGIDISGEQYVVGFPLEFLGEFAQLVSDFEDKLGADD